MGTPNFEETWNKWIVKLGFNQSEVLPHDNAIKAFKEVWNLAIEKAAEEAKTIHYTNGKDYTIDKQTILKLKLTI